LNWFRSSKRPQDHALDPEFAHQPDQVIPLQKEDPILSLQRSAGNQAVQKLLERARGQPIPEGDRTEMEAAFGQDLGDVRIHRDEAAGDLAAGLDASAFTTGRDIYFAPGAYTPAALSHEVTHVIQQSQAASFLPAEDPALEHQAGAASSTVMSGRTAGISPVASAPAVQRQALPGAPTPSVKLLSTDSVTLDGFEIDKFALSGSQKQKLDEFAKRLMKTLASAPDSMVSIIGFADAPGTDAHNLALGQKRADTVRDYLAAKGIPAHQLQTLSLGEGSPVVASQGHEIKNRRVEIQVVERSLFKPSLTLTPPAPAPAPAVPPPKPIDLTYHPEQHTSTPGEDLQERLRQIDRAVREAQEEEKAAHGISAADVTGRVLRRAAKKLGLPTWVQDRAEKLGQSLPSMGARAAVGQLAAEKGLDANTRNALGAVVDALMRTKVQ
jgi:outer membrane protein OmpA-like peptidoglycan-associated protein